MLCLTGSSLDTNSIMLFVLQSSIVADEGVIIVIVIIIIGNRNHVQAKSERNFSQLLQSLCSLYT